MNLFGLDHRALLELHAVVFVSVILSDPSQKLDLQLGLLCFCILLGSVQVTCEVSPDFR